MKLWIRIALTVCLLLILFISLLDPKKVFWHINQSQPEWMLLAVGVFVLSNILASFQWMILTRPLVKENPFYLFKLYWTGLFFNNFLPGNIGGDFYKAVRFSRRSREPYKVWASIIADRFMGLVAVQVIPLGAAIYFFTGTTFWIAMSILTAALLAVLFFGLYSRKIFKFIDRGYKDKRKNKGVKAGIVKLLQALSAYQGRRNILFKSFSIAILVQLLRILMNYYVFVSLSIDIPWQTLWIGIPIVSIISAVPIAIQGLGIREWSGTFLLGLLDSPDANLTTSFLLLGHLATVVGNLLGAPFFILESRDKKKN